jgi:hypothetical protein
VDRFDPKTILVMHQDIPLFQSKNFHLGYCGGPVFLSSGHVVAIILFKLHDINFAVHLSAIKEILKGVDLVSLLLACNLKLLFLFKADDIMINYPNVSIILPYIYFLLWFHTP